MTTNAIRKFIETHAVGPVDDSHPQIRTFAVASGRTVHIFVKDNGGFDSAFVDRNGNTVGHCSTLKSLTALVG